MSLLVLFRPAVVSPPNGTTVRRVSETPSALIGLLATGFYGGFVQAGVGFLLLASIAGTLRYDIIRANAIKLVCTFVFTLVSPSRSLSGNAVAWMEGLILSIGYVAGAYFWRQVCCVHRSKGTEMVLIRSHTARQWQR